MLRFTHFYLGVVDSSWAGNLLASAASAVRDSPYPIRNTPPTTHENFSSLQHRRDEPKCEQSSEKRKEKSKQEKKWDSSTLEWGHIWKITKLSIKTELSDIKCFVEVFSFAERGKIAPHHMRWHSSLLNKFQKFLIFSYKCFPEPLRTFCMRTKNFCSFWLSNGSLLLLEKNIFIAVQLLQSDEIYESRVITRSCACVRESCRHTSCCHRGVRDHISFYWVALTFNGYRSISQLKMHFSTHSRLFRWSISSARCNNDMADVDRHH